jgi:hypothetical protein
MKEPSVSTFAVTHLHWLENNLHSLQHRKPFTLQKILLKALKESTSTKDMSVKMFRSDSGKSKWKEAPAISIDAFFDNKSIHVRPSHSVKKEPVTMDENPHHFHNSILSSLQH